jgi:hypothetical protein
MWTGGEKKRMPHIGSLTLMRTFKAQYMLRQFPNSFNREVISEIFSFQILQSWRTHHQTKKT